VGILAAKPRKFKGLLGTADFAALGLVVRGPPLIAIKANHRGLPLDSIHLSAARKTMATEEQPTLNSWYETDEGTLFQVTAINEASDTVETVSLDGSADELSLSDWGDLPVSEVVAPDDWQGDATKNVSDWKALQK
jgi:hypothetical protein